MFQSIPPKRLLLYLMLSALIPITIAWFSFSSKLDQINEIKEQLSQLKDRAFIQETKQSSNSAIKNHFQDADHFYIDKNLETLSFLDPEVESLRTVLDNPNFPDDDLIKKRFDNLTGKGNTMIFTEGVVQSSQGFQEVTETLAHPIEVNVDDIRQILCRIEGVAMKGCTPPLNRPQLLILDFKIEKKNVSEKNEVFILNLKLLKREFL